MAATWKRHVITLENRGVTQRNPWPLGGEFTTGEVGLGGLLGPAK